MSITGLMRAAGRGDLEGVKRNLNQIGKQDEDGKTALMWAVRGGHANCIPLLEKEIGIQENDGWTALMYAARDGHANCIPLLMNEVGKQKGDSWTALMLAASNGNTDSVRLLLSEAGKQTTEEWKFTSAHNRVTFHPGTTALMLAAYFNYPEVVELLLPCEQGMKDSKGHTAKWHAKNSSKGGNFTRVRQLLENEAQSESPRHITSVKYLGSGIVSTNSPLKTSLSRKTSPLPRMP
ncbi:Ankyrin repeat protein 1 [Giardia muris]|uniref:Ankyrin repeat protein 1 n=1 Tax=Giardia muris TaxID=5742 RepID=A0A4Z1SWM2_GIAMU|nr:Ankyrin repeat protein 1 [Giardia muris]|eukprot:TNJ26133.1 Ankyrin repeat protein 1 [Giardia muris]